MLALSCPYVGPMLDPHSPRATPRVAAPAADPCPPGSAAGAARHYNLRLPTEGLRQGHGASVPSPGFKGLRLTAGRRPKGP